MSEHQSRHPTACQQAGLSCESCTEQTAAELARACRGLSGKMVARLFVQLYPAPACSRMHAHFAAAYRAASRAEQHGAEWEDSLTPAPSRGRALAAFA